MIYGGVCGVLAMKHKSHKFYESAVCECTNAESPDWGSLSIRMYGLRHIGILYLGIHMQRMCGSIDIDQEYTLTAHAESGCVLRPAGEESSS